MKIDPNAPAYPSEQIKELGNGWQSHQRNLGIPIRLAIAAQLTAALLQRYGAYTDDCTAISSMKGATESAPNIDEISLYALAQADALIAAYNGDTK